MIKDSVLKNEELAIIKLRSLYERYGYKQYKMSKFEEYELYVANKDFLVSDRVITFNDTNGKLLALKPDVTLSIIKNLQDSSNIHKLYYNENVYRISQSTGCFKEIMQTGLECIGDISVYDIYEVIMLATKSLLEISREFVIEISNLSLIELAIKKASNSETFKDFALKYLESKNSHDLIRLCDEYNVEKANADTLLALINAYGKRSDVINKLKKHFDNNEIKDIVELSNLLDLLPTSKNITFDFSAKASTNYYNGFIFRGFINGINERVLSGGQYDKMMTKLSKKMGAIGFAIYLDLLEELSVNKDNNGVDSLIIYDVGTKTEYIIKTSNELINQGKKVMILKEVEKDLAYNELIDLRRNKNA